MAEVLKKTLANRAEVLEGCRTSRSESRPGLEWRGATGCEV